MDVKYIVAAVLAVIIIATAGFILSTSHKGAGSPANSQNRSANSTAQSAQSTGAFVPIRFNQTDYYNYSYLISTGNLSAQTKNALGPFSPSFMQFPNGTARIVMTLAGRSGNQTIMVPGGERLYFVDGSLRDDNSTADSNFTDDGLAVVNATGYVVNMNGNSAG